MAASTETPEQADGQAALARHAPQPPCPAARPRLRRDAERNRQRILRAAAEVFTERGLEATLDDVARHAGVGVGTVYRRFPDKVALVSELFQDRIDAMVAEAERAHAEPDPWTGLVSYLKYVAETFAGDLGLRQMMMFGAHGGTRTRYARERMRPAVTRLVKRAQAAGQVRADLRATDIPFIAIMLTTAGEYAAQVRPDIWRRYLNLIIDGLRPERDTATPLPVAALTPQELEQMLSAGPGGGAGPGRRFSP
ncbi:MAG: TetR/AcrR family transcriptional regulator [Streptosporangiaceae bacterium]|nr:TetR/AcrR family transcriptional regulator [Streptosporangiaceae bacterium]MBV9858351.1 TetR/AcrR family transcriptional regulator [Streptosporangiaceae bacterium]